MKAITDVSVTITRLVSPDILKYYTLNSQRWVDIGGDINIRVKRPELVKDFDVTTALPVPYCSPVSPLFPLFAIVPSPVLPHVHSSIVPFPRYCS